MGRVKYSQFEHRIDVDELISDLGFSPEYEDNRGNYVGYCMWPENHSNGDTTGKFAIHPDKKVYNCYVCGGGSLLSLVMELKSWDSETAEDYLRQFAGDQRDDVEFLEGFLNAFAKDAENRAETLPFFNPRVLEKYDWAFDYGASIGLRANVIHEYNVLYAPEAFKPSPGKGKFADDDPYVGPAILWPHYWNDRLVGWQSRWIACTNCWHDHLPGEQCEDCSCAATEGVFERPQWCGKWTNTTDFPKDHTLYGWHRKAGFGKTFVVESAKTVLKLSQMGYSAVGTFGSNVNDAQLRLLRRCQAGVILCPDNDKAGDEWFLHLYGYLKQYVPVYALTQVGIKKGDLADLSDEEADDHIRERTVDLSVAI
jgi:DNA primase